MGGATAIQGGEREGLRPYKEGWVGGAKAIQRNEGERNKCEQIK